MQKREKRLLVYLILVALWAFSLWLYDKNIVGTFHSRHDFPNSDRFVYALIIVDDAFVGVHPHHEKESAANELLGRASEYFEKSVGIRFVPCGFEVNASVDMNVLTAASRGGCEVVIGLTGLRPKTDDVGEAEKSDGVVLLNTYYNHRSERFLAHELGHLFGAWHRNRIGYLMHPEGTFMGDVIDDLSWHLMMFNKYRDFR